MTFGFLVGSKNFCKLFSVCVLVYFALYQSRSVPSYDLWTFSKYIFLSEPKSLLLSNVHFFAKFQATLLSQSACREVSSDVVPQNRARKDFAHEVYLFG